MPIRNILIAVLALASFLSTVAKAEVVSVRPQSLVCQIIHSTGWFMIFGLVDGEDKPRLLFQTGKFNEGANGVSSGSSPRSTECNRKLAIALQQNAPILIDTETGDISFKWTDESTKNILVVDPNEVRCFASEYKQTALFREIYVKYRFNDPVRRLKYEFDYDYRPLIVSGLYANNSPEAKVAAERAENCKAAQKAALKAGTQLEINFDTWAFAVKN